MGCALECGLCCKLLLIVISILHTQAVSASTIFINIVQQEGVGALFKGCIPRMVWTAPQGAMNFAGYELAKRALNGRTMMNDA